MLSSYSLAYLDRRGTRIKEMVRTPAADMARRPTEFDDCHPQLRSNGGCRSVDATVGRGATRIECFAPEASTAARLARRRRTSSAAA